MFLNQVTEQLNKMSESEKDQWILTQAKLTEESRQPDFLMSLTGKKKILSIPTQEKIRDFCQKADNGELYLEYETHYCEFDDDGRYMDDWKVWYNDPKHVTLFLDKVFQGCQDLIKLDEHETAFAILDKVCRLTFQVFDASDSEDSAEEEEITLAAIGSEGMLEMDNRQIGSLWITAAFHGKKQEGGAALAKRLVGLFADPLCAKLVPEMLLSESGSSDEALLGEVYSAMAGLLQQEIAKDEETLRSHFSGNSFSEERYDLEKCIARKRELLLNIERRCMAGRRETPQEEKKVSVLAASWTQIEELLLELQYEPYIDDQWQIEEIWKICGALAKREGLLEEDWRLRKHILLKMLENEYYDDYGCYDPMLLLSEKLCGTPEEMLAFADMMNRFPYYQKKAALLYRQYGREDRYISYLKTHLEKESETYTALMRYYQEQGDSEKARQVAEQGKDRCKDDLTDIYIFLLEDARKQGDESRYKKLYASARRRRAVNDARVDEALKASGTAGSKA